MASFYNIESGCVKQWLQRGKAVAERVCFVYALTGAVDVRGWWSLHSFENRFYDAK
jgi:hypothetical protein